MEIAECHIVVAHFIHGLSCIVVTQKGRIAFNKGMNVFFCQQIGCDALDLLRRASVQGGQGCTAAYSSGNRFCIFCCKVLKTVRIVQQPLSAFLENGSFRCILQAFDEAVDLLGFDAFQIIAHAHVELETVHGAQSPFLCHEFQSKPCFYIFVKCLRHI